MENEELESIMSKIGLDKLKKIIQEEMISLHEGMDHDTAAKIMGGASKLLKAIESFKNTASEKVKAEMGSNLEEVEKLLNRIATSPMQYVDVTKPAARKVSLKSQKSSPVI